MVDRASVRTALSALLAVVAIACGPTGQIPNGGATPAPGATGAGGGATATIGPVTPSISTHPGTEAPVAEPQPVQLSGDRYAWRFAVAPDGDTALVGQSSGFFPTSRESRIDLVRRQADGSWGEAERASFSTGLSADLDPFFSPDGSRVWFSSIRPVDGVARTDTDIWFVDRAPDGTFGEPVNAGPEINSPGEDLFPSLGADGTLWLGSDRGGNGFDIWRVPAIPGGWGAAEVLPAPVTTATWEFNPVIAPDGRTMVFTALGRPGGPGLGDLWLTTWNGVEWSEPTLLPVVNTARDEYHASFAPDGRTMYFVRDGVLHEVATRHLGLSAER